MNPEVFPDGDPKQASEKDFTKVQREAILLCIAACEEEEWMGANSVGIGRLSRACDIIDKQATPPRYGKCPKGHITMYRAGETPHCAVADCRGPVICIEIVSEYLAMARQLEAKDRLIEWVWKTSITLFEAKDRCKQALKGEEKP